MCQKIYYIRVNGTPVEVTKEQYLCYFRSERRMRYFEHDIKIETPVRDRDGNIIGYAPCKEDSIERLIASGVDLFDESESVEDTVIRHIITDKLHEGLNKLPKGERALIDALFFSNGGDGMSEREYAAATGVHRMTVHSRKVRIFQKLKKILKK